VDIEAWQQAGLYDPNEPNAAERLALLEYLTERGATIEQMVEAHHQGTLPGVAGDLVTQGRTHLIPVTEIAERSGVPVERVLRVLLAAGIPATLQTEVSDELVRLMAAFEQGRALLGEDAVLAFTRVLGASAMNIAEAAVALFFAEFGPGTVREGPDELARAVLSEAATTAFTAVPDVMAQAVMDQFERSQRRAQLARVWAAPAVRSEDDGPAEKVALGFVDLVGSTAWAETQSLRDQNLALTRFESAAWSSAVLAGGRVVKMIGDEVFFSAPTAEAACRIGTEVCLAADEDPGLPPDYFGPLVNLLSRLTKVGGPGELVATEAAVKELPPERWQIEELELVGQRDVPGPVRVFRVEPKDASGQSEPPAPIG
jgi:adenylate cyclase